MSKFTPPDGKSYTIDEDGNVLLINGNPLTKNDEAHLFSMGIKHKPSKKVKEEVKKNVIA